MAAPMASTLVLKMQQWRLWHAMEEAMEKQNLTTITVPAGELQWVRKGKEINWHGRYFDVKTIAQQPDGHYRLTGLYDEDEKSIKLALHTSGEGHQKESGRAMWQFISLLSAAPLTNSSFAIAGIATAYIFYRHPAQDNRLFAEHADVPTPPPLG